MSDIPIKIDLKEEPFTKIPVFEGYILPPISKPKLNKIKAIFIEEKPTLPIPYHRLAVEKVVLPESFVLTGSPNNALLIEAPGRDWRSSEHLDLSLDQNAPKNIVNNESIAFPFKIFFNEGHLFDVKISDDITNYLGELSFDLVKLKSGSELEQRKKENIVLEVLPSKGNLELMLKADGQEFKYEGTALTRVGELEIVNQSKYTFAEYLKNLVVKLKVGGMVEGTVCAGSMITIGKEYVMVNESTPTCITIIGLPGKKRAFVPIYIDFNKIDESDEMVTIEVEAICESSNVVSNMIFSVSPFQRKPAPPNPECSFKLSSGFGKSQNENELDYEHRPDMELGNLQIINRPGNKLQQEDWSGIVAIESVEGGSKIAFFPERLQSPYLTRVDARQLRVNNLPPSVEGVTVPVLLATNKLGWLHEPLAQTLEISMDGNVNLQQYFSIGKYVSSTAIKVEVKNFSKTTDVLQQQGATAHHRANPVQWDPKSPSHEPSICCTVVISNESKTKGGPGGVLIGNLRLELMGGEGVESQNGNHPTDWLRLRIREGARNETIIKPNQIDAKETWLIRDGRPSLSLNLEFLDADLERIVNNEAKVQAIFHFDYVEDKWEAEQLESGSNRLHALEKGIPRSLTVSFAIEKHIGNEWLAVDLGTSAIVAAFGDQDPQNMKLLNLQRVLKNYQPNYETSGLEEKSTPFLSSILLLEDGKRLNAENYSENLVEYSPVPNKFEASPDRRIPYLKSVVGVDSLLDVNIGLKGMTYIDEQGQERICSERSPLRVRDILGGAYYTVLKHFALASAEVRERGTDEISRLVLTHPNTFTPLHLEIISQLLLKQPELKKSLQAKHLSFVSESDAVAVIYHDAWQRCNERRHAADKAAFERGEKPEHVLVYDMGAGTLDLTWLKMERKPDAFGKYNHHTHCTILGRLGKNSAGNYFDYELAEIFRDVYGKQGTGASSHGHFIAAPFGSLQFHYKRFIRNTVKPWIAGINPELPEGDVLRRITNESLFGGGKEFVASAKEIFQHPQFEKLMEDNTALLFSHFFKLFGNGQAQGVPLDTVLLSGRGSQLTSLRKRIADALVKISGNKRLHVVGMEQIVPPEAGNAYLKSIVVQGALRYTAQYRLQQNAALTISGDRMMARYGILFGDKARDNYPWQFIELLGPNDLPYEEELSDSSLESNAVGYLSEFKQVNASHAAQIYFVQSFLPSDCDIDRRYFPNVGSFDTDYITIIKEFDRKKHLEDQGDFIAQLWVTPDKRMTLNLAQVGDPDNILATIDSRTALRNPKSDSPAFKKSMWPYL